MLSLTFFKHLATLPLRLIITTVQYFTTGTVFTNDFIRKSLKRTFQCTVFQHMGGALLLDDLKVVDAYSVNSLILKLTKNLNSQSDLPNSGEVYSTIENDGCESTWLTRVENRSKTDPIVVYIHGGCFAIQLKDMSVEYFANLYRVLKKDYNKPVSILIADYSLLPQNAVFPQQYDEISKLYDKLTKEGNSNIVVMGDSAGGNLTVNLIQHLHQKPNPVWPAGIIPISPWLDVTNVSLSGSFKTNANLDVFTYQAVDYYGKEYVRNTQNDKENPLVNITFSTIDWTQIPVFKEGKCLFVFGEYEILLDQIFKFIEKVNYKENFPERIVVDPKGVHIGLFISETIDYNNDLSIWKSGFCTEKILKFIAEVTEN